MSKAHVIGLGKSGVAAARLLKREGWEVEIGDRNTSPNLLHIQQELAAENITVKLAYSLELDGVNDPQLIVVSPGVPWDIPLLVQARAVGIETIGEMELAWRNLDMVPWVGITGTNGKTTTTSLVAAIFQTAGLSAPGCGNIGYAATEVALKYGKTAENPPPIDWVIGEVSSYQVESSSTLAPRIGIWTTFTPDHLARHKTLENYYEIKAKLLRKSELQIVNGDDAYLRQVGLSQWENAYWTSVNGLQGLIGKQGFYIEDGWVTEKLTPQSAANKIIPASALNMVGSHNLQNLLMAVAAARLAGIEKDAIHQAIREFPGVPHRVELICTWSDIQFINDSKATNYDAAEVGLKSVAAPTILIAGGEAKEGEDKAWLNSIQAQAAYVLLIGNAAEYFAQRLDSIGYINYENAGTMTKAVELAGDLAKKYQAKSVLLSPACASFDQYPNFEVRGDDFRQLCLDRYGS